MLLAAQAPCGQQLRVRLSSRSDLQCDGQSRVAFGWIRLAVARCTGLYDLLDVVVDRPVG